MMQIIAITIVGDSPSPPHGFDDAWIELRDKYDVISEVSYQLDIERFCVDYGWTTSLESPGLLEKLRHDMNDLGDQFKVDVSVQKASIFRRYKKLAVFDMDSTLIEQECIDEIAAFAGLHKKVAHITERAMRGEIDFKESLQQRVHLLKGLPEDVLDKVRAKLTYNKGVIDTCRALKRLGCKLLLVSGGFTHMASKVRDELGFDYCFANELGIQDGKLTGTVNGPIVDGQRKADLLETVAQLEKIPLCQVIAVGDGANDIPMMQRASMGVAFKAKPKVNRLATARISSGNMLDLLYFMRITDREVEELIAFPQDGKKLQQLT